MKKETEWSISPSRDLNGKFAHGATHRTATRGIPEESDKLITLYAKKHDLSEKDARDYLIYVGFNRRAALERYTPAKKQKRPSKKKPAKKAV